MGLTGNYHTVIRHCLENCNPTRSLVIDDRVSQCTIYSVQVENRAWTATVLRPVASNACPRRSTEYCKAYRATGAYPPAAGLGGHRAGRGRGHGYGVVWCPREPRNNHFYDRSTTAPSSMLVVMLELDASPACMLLAGAALGRFSGWRQGKARISMHAGS